MSPVDAESLLQDAVRHLDAARLDEALAAADAAAAAVPSDGALWAEAQAVAARVQRIRAEVQPALRRLQQGRRVALDGGHDRALVQCLLELAYHEAAPGTEARDQDPLQEAWEVARGSGQPDLEAEVLARVAIQGASDPQAAPIEVQAWIDRMRRLGETARASLAEGLLWWRVGDHAAAEAALHDAHAGCVAQGRLGLAIEVVGHLARAAWHRHDLEAAERLLREQLQRFEAVGSAPGACQAWNNLGEVHLARGQLHDAAAAFEASIEVGRPVGRPAQFVAPPLANLGVLRVRQGRLDDARALLMPLVLGGRDALFAHLTACLGLLEAAARARDAPLWDLAAARLGDVPPRPDLAELADRAGRAARHHTRWKARSAWALALAHGLWEATEPGRTPALSRQLAELRADGAPVPLGPFRLRDVIGTGAVGTVFEARSHDDRDVAIKVLAGRSSPLAARLLRNELRAVAGLEHPHIIELEGHGEVTGAAAAMMPELQPGAPWIAMELVTGGTLEPWCGRLRWRACRTILLALLDALAHAHARGVLHLDIKPANVLMAGTSKAPLPRLADFGLAHSSDSADRVAGGTPAFMAPEQFDGRHLGPWTDLYAVGGLAVALVSGTAPFGSTGSLDHFREAHRTHLPPPLKPAVAVPVGLEAWTRRCLAKDPEQRFRHAADAARALAALHGRGMRAERGAPEVRPALQLTTVVLTPDPEEPEQPSAHDDPAQLADVPEPVVPPSWRRPHTKERRTSPGIALFHLRPVPFVGRIRERSLLWTTLREVATRRRPRVVVLEGVSGSGTTRLAAWLTERAAEIGLATVRTDHAAARGAPRAAMQRVVQALLDRDDRVSSDLSRSARLALLATAGGHGDVEGEALATMIADMVVQRAEERPLVWHIDAAQWSGTLLEVVLALLGRDCCVLVILTVGHDLGGHDEAASLLQTLVDHRATLLLPVGPLAADEHRALIDAMLPLTVAAADAIAARTAGDPGYAVELLRHLVERDGLRREAHGYALAADLTLPPDLGRLWQRRLTGVLSQLEPAALGIVRLVGLLAPTVPSAVLEAAAAQLGHDPGQVTATTDALVAARVLEPDGTGWRFLSRQAPWALAEVDGGSRHALHRACADALREVAGVGEASRIADHLEAAAALVDALACLQQGVGLARQRADGDLEAALIDRCRTLVARLGLPVGSTERHRLAADEALHLLHGGRPEEAAQRCEDQLRAEPVGGVYHELRGTQRRAWTNLGRSADARASAQHDLPALLAAVDTLDQLPVEEREVVIRHAIDAAWFAHDDEAEKRCTAAARGQLAAIGDPLLRARLVVTATRETRADLDAQLAELHDAQRTLEAHGWLRHAHTLIMWRGGCLDLAGRFEEAAATHRMLAEDPHVDRPRRLHATLSLALSLWRAGHDEEGDAVLPAIAAPVREAGPTMAKAWAFTWLVVAIGRDPHTWQQAFRAARAQHEKTPMLVGVGFTCLEVAVARAERVGHPDRAAALHAWAQHLAQTTGGSTS